MITNSTNPNNHNNFLPKDYSVPVAGGNYMKFEKGDNVFRILSHAVVGYEYWTKDNKPVRLLKRPDIIPADMRPDMNKNYTFKHFWAFIVWNYKASAIQMLEVTQVSIQTAISNLVEDVDWGDPMDYDIKVTKTGEKMDTEYTVNPKPHSPIKEEIKQALLNKDYDLNNLFQGKEVFDVKTSDGGSMPSFEKVEMIEDEVGF